MREVHLIGLLSVLLSNEMALDERRRILREEFGLPMTKEIAEEMNSMCNLSYEIARKNFEQGILQGEERGEKRGIAQGMERGIAQGMERGIAQGMERGVRQGVERSRAESIRSLMETLHLTAEQAMDALRIPAAERAKYAAMLG